MAFGFGLLHIGSVLARGSEVQVEVDRHPLTITC